MFCNRSEIKPIVFRELSNAAHLKYFPKDPYYNIVIFVETERSDIAFIWI